jgi:hypothetical protein
VNLRSSPNDRSAFILIAAQNSSQKESARSWRADLIGQYDSSVAFGQSRVLQVWTRIIMPDGASIVGESRSTKNAAALTGRAWRVGSGDLVKHHRNPTVIPNSGSVAQQAVLQAASQRAANLGVQLNVVIFGP